MKGSRKKLLVPALASLVLFGAVFSISLAVSLSAQAAPTFNENPVVISGKSITFKGTPDRFLNWTSYDGYSLTAGTASLAGNADTVDGIHALWGGTSTGTIWSLASGNVGIGVTNPVAKLDVNGIINATALYVNGSPYIGSQWTTQGTSIYYNTGNVGVGVSAPSSKLEVSGSISASGTVNGTGLCIGGDCRASWAAAGSYWTGYGTNIASNNSGNVGIGTTAPGQKLAVNGSILLGAIKMTDSGGELALTDNAGIYNKNIRANSFYLAGPMLAVAGSQSGDTWTTFSKDRIYVSNTDSYTIAQNNLTSDAATKNIIIRAQNAYSSAVTNLNGGDVFLYGGTKTGAGLDGDVILANTGVASLGNVGVGTTNPGYKLDVNGTANIATSLVVPSISMGSSGAVYTRGIYSWGTNDLNIGDGDGNIYMQGNVGIAKTNPSAALDVIGSGTFTGTVNGTGLCIGGDCKTSWAAVGSASSGWTQNGAEVYKTNTSGNVGIGTTNPARKLQVVGDIRLGGTTPGTNQMIEFNTATNWQYYLKAINDDLYLQDSESANFIKASYSGGGVNKYISLLGYLTVKNSGNVGIGTTNPGYKLTVNGDAHINDKIRLGTAGDSYIEHDDSNLITFNQSNWGGDFVFRAADTGGTPSDRLWIEGSTGNVGVGTTAPDYKFKVVGDANITTNLTVNNSVQIPEAGYLRVKQILPYASGGLVSIKTYNAATDILTVDTNSQNVGIAKTNPGATLDVVGSGTFTGTVNGTGLCIGGDCKTSWAAVGSASSGWTQNGAEVYKTNTSGNVGVGTTNPGAKLEVQWVGAYNPTPTSNPIIQWARPGGAVLGALGYDETNTKLYLGSVTSHKLSLRTGDADRVTIDTSGNVGIGTTTPSQKLTIFGGNASGQIRMGYSDSSSWSIGRDNMVTGDFVFVDGPSTEMMRITHSGKVGIGTTNPTGNLHIKGTNTALNIEAGSSANYAVLQMMGGYAQRNEIDFGYATGSGYNKIVSYNPTHATRAYEMGFVTNSSERMTIGASGNVGIAKSNPATTLDVVGSASFTGTVNGTGLCIGGDCRTSWAAAGSYWTGYGSNIASNNSGNVGIGTTAPASKLHIYGLGASVPISKFEASDSVSYSHWYNSVTGNNNFTDGVSLGVNSNIAYLYNRETADFNIGTDNSTDLTIKSGGNIGIGVTNPEEKLEIYSSAGDVSALIYAQAAASYPSAKLKFRSYNVTQGITDAQISVLSSDYNKNSMAFSVEDNNVLSEKMRITDLGNVGVGITNPGAKLDVSSNNNPEIKIYDSGAISANGIGMRLVHHLDSWSDQYFGLRGTPDGATTTDYMRINMETGNIGIAKTNPGATLDIVGSLSASGTVNGTGLCIGGDCKASWAAVGSASSGWTQNGAEVYKTNTSGNVGIGTTAPTSKLTVTDGGVNTYHIDGTDGFESQYSGSIKLRAYTTGGDGLILGWDNDGNNNLQIHSDDISFFNGGNVGIGTTSPIYKLDIAGSSHTTLRIFAPSSVSSNIILDSGATNSWGLMNGYVNGGVFQITKGAVGSIPTTPVMTFNTSGNVGIGTTAPSEKLHVIGNILVDWNDGGRIGMQYPSDGLNYRNGFAFSATNRQTIIEALTPSSDSEIIFRLGTVASPSEKMRIDSDGNIGIAKTNPGATLDVVGSGTFTGTVNGTGLCIGGDCKTSWAAVGSASSGWTQNGAEVYKTNTSGNVGIGTTSPGAKLEISNTGLGLATPALVIDGDDASADSALINLSRGSNGRVSGTLYSLDEVNEWFTGTYYNAGSPQTNFGIGAGYDVANQKLVITTTGNIGIGTTAPAAKMEIKGAETADTTYLRITNQPVATGRYKAGLEFWNNEGTVANTSYNTGRIYSVFDGTTYATSRLTLGSASGNGVFDDTLNIKGGNVGIGTTNPGQLLHVKNTSSVSVPMVMLEGYNHVLGLKGATPYAEYFDASNNRLGWFGYGLNATDFYFSNDVAGKPLYFATDGYSNIRMTILGTSGNVGIAKTNPSATLDVTGSISASGTVNGTGLCIAGDCRTSWAAAGSYWTGYGSNIASNNSGNVGVGTTAPDYKFKVVGDANITTNLTVNNSVQIPEAGYLRVKQILPYVNGGLVSIKTYNAATDILTVDTNSQNVGIGTTDPGTYKLNVNGGLQATSLAIVDGSRVISNDNGYLRVHGSGGVKLTVWNGGYTDALVVAPTTGNIGVGTSTSREKLEVSGNLYLPATNRIYFDTTGSTKNNYIGTTEDYLTTIFGGRGLGSELSIGNGIFKVSTGAVERMRITDVGNVGIAKTNPGTTLDITGSISASGTVNATGLCIAGDCRTSWAAAGSYWTGYGSNIASNNSGSVGIGTTAPGAYFNSGNAAKALEISGNGKTGIRLTDSSSVNQYFNIGVDGANAYLEAIYSTLPNINYKAYGHQAFYTGSTPTENVRITSAGNVGVGTTGPGAKLDVRGDIYLGVGMSEKLRAGAGLSYIEMYNISTGDMTFHSTFGTGNFRFNTANSTTTKFFIKYDGNVGIGTTNPTTILHVVGGANQPVLVTRNSKSMYLNANWSDGNAFAQLAPIEASNMGLSLSSKDTHPEYLYISTSGNVGIAKTNPGTTLDIVGSLSASGTVNGTGLCIGGDCKTSWAAVGSASSGWTQNGNEVYKTNTAGNIGIGTTAPTSKLTVTDGGVNTYHIDGTDGFESQYSGSIKLRAYTTGGDGLILGWDNDGNNNLQIHSDDISFFNGGNVGIGTTAPTARLQVAGGLVLNRTGVSNTDYTAQATDYIIGFSSLSANRTLTLPNALCTSGRVFLIVNETSSAYSVIVDPEGSTTIIGQTSLSLPAYNSTPVYCNGSAWFIY